MNILEIAETCGMLLRIQDVLVRSGRSSTTIRPEIGISEGARERLKEARDAVVSHLEDLTSVP